MIRRRGPVELLVTVILVAILLQVAIDYIRPLVPYIMVAAVVLGLVWVGKVIIKRRQNW